MVASKTPSMALLVIGWFALSNIACNEEGVPFEPMTPRVPPLTPLPPITDAIPYDVLESGKIVFERRGAGEFSGIYVIDIDNDSSWGIRPPEIMPWSPAVSPNGQKIAFIAWGGVGSTWETPGGSAYDVFIMNIDGANAENVSEVYGQDRFASWTPGGLKILFWVEWSSKLYMQSPVAKPTDRVLIRDFTAGGFFLAPYGPVSASSNGKIAYVIQSTVSSVNPAGLYTMNMDGSNLALLVPSPANSRLHWPAFSPDGKNIAYIECSTSAQTIEIMLIDTNGSNLNSVAILEAELAGCEWSTSDFYPNDLSICWSPDGSKLLFNKPDGDRENHIYLINSNGSGLTQVTFAERVTDRSVSWSN